MCHLASHLLQEATALGEYCFYMKGVYGWQNLGFSQQNIALVICFRNALCVINAAFSLHLMHFQSL